MTLKDLNLKIKYDSSYDNMIKDFYIPTLSNSTKYYRLSGFFSSSVLKAVARGMEEFIKNNGKMQLICSVKLQKEDIKKIEEFNEDPEQILESYLIDSLDDIEDKFTKDHVGALGWMLVKGNLEIKLAIVDSKAGMFHQKTGILEDNDGNGIAFSGSNNETETGLIHNVEEFKVFKNWDNGKDWFQQDKNDFLDYWNNENKKTKVINLPKAIKNKIIEIAPKNFEGFNLPGSDEDMGYEEIGTLIERPKEPEIKLRDYQEEAIEKWFENGKRGIFEMATGTGKTITALSCFKKVYDEEDDLLTIIAVPQLHLSDQWIKDLNKFYHGKIIVASSKNHKWKKEIKNTLSNFILGIEKKLVIVTSHDSLSLDTFIDSILKFKAKKLLIVDEVHGIGSQSRLKSLLEDYDYRLGLSATPERWFDDEGTNALMNYFSGVVFTFDIGDALNIINPDTGEFYLTPYVYHPVVVDLNQEELESYNYYSAKIANLLNSKKKKDKDKLTTLCMKRKNIINNAEAKYDKLIEILDENPDIKDLIVFSSPQQLETVQKILNDKNISQHKFTFMEKVTKQEKYGGLTEREYLIKNFENGNYRALVAMKCLDEGVDIPSARTAIIMSSTSNPREHVQRRGRILRHFPGKKEANIYDMLVFPNNYNESTKKRVEREARRYREFAVNAKNSMECLNTLKRYMGD
ncbi:DEAD/DEAH box helicase family protein [Methanobrevibacter curvatus]|uniref:ATP-dependent RNA helicase DbpA n=1 Tax=Methanobrevibacter curvatus TaxID=49547 RepID=A0A166B3C4_9EURY|nr:DEAD/DEAH box helicase family protein [Methanobrevibacter curvatus]KZX12813.1 ATP-dependent RNA helicase DbpA [Methanobrevibacter curvatus]